MESVPGWRHPIMTAKLVVFLLKHAKWLCRVKDRYLAVQEARVWVIVRNGRIEIDEVAE